MLNDAGGIASDLTVSRLAQNSFRLMLGTAALKRDLSYISNHILGDNDVQICDVTADLAVLGLHGPDSKTIASSVGAGWMNDLDYFQHATGSFGDVAVRAARLSYIGEAGWELICDASDASRLFVTLTAAGAVPIGALAQASMRIEKGFLAYGQDLDTDVTPAMAGLEFALANGKHFIGKDALDESEYPATQLVSLGFADIDVVPLGNEPVICNGRVIGKTTSAAFGYRVGRPVAIAILESAAAVNGGLIQVDIAGEMADASISKAPMFDPSGSRMRSKGN